MRYTDKLKKRLEYARFLHLLMIYIIVLCLFLFTTIPHKEWVLLTALVLSAGIQPGLIVKRSVHRIAGTLLALLLLIPLLYIMQLNYRLVSVFFIIALMASAVTGLNIARYDIKVFFTTIVVFFLIAQTNNNTSNGPFEMVLNRSICTFIGVGIVLISDYFLFNTYSYSQKLYLYHQMMLYQFFKTSIKEIKKARQEGKNTAIFIERLRSSIVNQFYVLSLSSNNLKLDIRASQNIKHHIKAFEDTAWELRHALFALTFSELILYSPEASEAHQVRYNILLKKARQYLIKNEI